LEANEFGIYLKELRTGKKMTIRKLEMLSEVSNAYISQLERGERGIPSPDILEKLAKPLGVDYEKLMAKAGYIKKYEKNKVKEEIMKYEINDQKRKLIEMYDALPKDKQNILDRLAEVMIKEMESEKN
jgi:transcriptional regulator with XRE-family HTH domain